MNPIKALRRLLSNSDRVNDVALTLDQLSRDVREKLDGLQQAADNQSTRVNERSGSFQQSADNLARDLNQNLRLLIEAVQSQTTGLGRQLDGLQQGADNQATDLNKRLDALIEAVNNQSGGANERSEEIRQAISNQSGAENLRLDRIIAAVEKALGAVLEGRAGPDEPVRDADRLSHKAANTESDIPLREAVAEPAWLLVSPDPMPLPRWFGNQVAGFQPPATTNTPQHYQPLLDAIEPWRGVVPKGYLVDFLGNLTDSHFRAQYVSDPNSAGGGFIETAIPRFTGWNGELWFEWVNWLEAAREARERFVMITLGACYGAQAVGAHRALQIVNPMLCKLVAVEPVPENYRWVRKHFRDNGIDPDAHWLVQAAASDTNQAVFFPIGAAGSGANNCIATDTIEERKALADRLIGQGKSAATLRNLMLNNTTGVIKDLLPNSEATGEIELVSAVTLRDLLAPFDRVDYLESDIQQSEARVFAPFIDLLSKKVRRIHIGTHGAQTHAALADLFATHGWEIVFDYAPEGTYTSDIGSFEVNDGILTVRNPNV